MNVENMSDAQFAAWKRRQEQDILRNRQESEKYQRKTDKILAELAESSKKTSANLDKTNAVLEKTNAVLDKTNVVLDKTNVVLDKVGEKLDKTSEKLDKVADQFGGWTNNANEKLEDEFAEAVEETMQIGEFRLNEVQKRVRFKYEYDLVGINGQAVVVGEVKRKLLPSDVRRFAEERLPHFAVKFSGAVKRRKIFGMVAGETITAAAKTEAQKYGFFILRLKNRKLLVENAANARAIN